MTKLYAYTRQFASETGAALHLSLLNEEKWTHLNHGFGVLFARADLSEGFDGCSKGLVKPWLFRTKDGGFGVAALRRTMTKRRSEDTGMAAAETSSAHQVLLFTSGDMLTFEELPLTDAARPGEAINDVRCAYENGLYILQVEVDDAWRTLSSETLGGFAPAQDRPVTPRPEAAIRDADGLCCLDVTDAEADVLITRLTPPALPGDAPEFPFPLMPPRGDPMAIRYGSGYLYMATDDERDQLALKIRYAETLAGIPAAKDHVIFTAHETGDFSGCLWAPELHWVGGRLCIFFAAGMPHWYTVQSRVMWLTGDDPLSPDSWSEPRRMERMDGGHITDEGITLDMTVVPSGGADYVIWSQRPMVVTDKVKCGTADLMVAKLNTRKPWRLASEPVTLSRPEYGWERIHSPVNEGPFLLKRGDTLFVTYAAALIDHTYAVGLLWANDGDDLTDPSVWTKCGYPVLHRLSMPGQLGAGHNAFVKDEQGRDMLLLHAIDLQNYLHDPADGRRYPCMRMVGWDKLGFPHLDCVKNAR